MADVTQRDLVLAQRKAWIAGFKQAALYRWSEDRLEAEAARLYPLPKITRPRVATDASGFDWRCVDGQLETRVLSQWTRHDVLYDTPERVRLWANLLDNPTEEVEDDGAG